MEIVDIDLTQAFGIGQGVDVLSQHSHDVCEQCNRSTCHEALAAGHAITTVVRDPRRVSGNVPVFTTDLASPDLGTLRWAIQSADAVLLGLGARLARDTGVAARGT